MNEKLVTLGPFISSRFSMPASVSERALMTRAEEVWRAASKATSGRHFSLFDDDDPRHSPASARMRAAA